VILFRERNEIKQRAEEDQPFVVAIFEYYDEMM
jgi:hypothetical protein